MIFLVQAFPPEFLRLSPGDDAFSDPRQAHGLEMAKHHRVSFPTLERSDSPLDHQPRLPSLSLEVGSCPVIASDTFTVACAQGRAAQCSGPVVQPCNYICRSRHIGGGLLGLLGCSRHIGSSDPRIGQWGGHCQPWRNTLR